MSLIGRYRNQWHNGPGNYIEVAEGTGTPLRYRYVYRNDPEPWSSTNEREIKGWIERELWKKLFNYPSKADIED